MGVSLAPLGGTSDGQRSTAYNVNELNSRCAGFCRHPIRHKLLDLIKHSSAVHWVIDGEFVRINIPMSHDPVIAGRIENENDVLAGRFKLLEGL